MKMWPTGSDVFDSEPAMEFLVARTEELFGEIRNCVKKAPSQLEPWFEALAALAMLNALNFRRELEVLPDPLEIQAWRTAFQTAIRKNLDWLGDAEKSMLLETADRELNLMLKAIETWRAA